jgi:N-acetylglucosamine-6-phosphate deacetylase
MSGRILKGRHYRTGRAIAIKIEDDRIGTVDWIKEDPGDRWLAPGLVDVQVNGYAGVDFQRDDLSEARLTRAAEGLAYDGCSRWLLTLITAEWSVLMGRLARLKEIRDASPILRRCVVGWHVEGPFLSEEPGYRGAHDASVMADPSVVAVEELRRVTGGDRVLLTLAPERRGAGEAIRRAVELGMTVSAGHTNASAEDLRGAVAAGCTGFTHLGNGMPQAMDRHDNIVCRALDTEGFAYGLIPDGIHVAPQLFRLIHRAVPNDRIYHTTDAMAAAGAPPGRYTIGSIELEVGEDEIVRMPGATNFAGSALRPIEGVRRAARMLGVGWRDVWDTFSVNPARLIGLECGLESGLPADVVVLTEGGELVDD